MLFLPSWLSRLLPCLAQVPQKRPLFSFCELKKKNRTKTETHKKIPNTLSHTHNATVSMVRTEAGSAVAWLHSMWTKVAGPLRVPGSPGVSRIPGLGPHFSHLFL